jgi:multiple sugar transport system permease protein
MLRLFAKRATVPYVLVVPLVAALGLFMLYPLYKVIENCFYEASFLAPFQRDYVGLGNFKWLFDFKVFDPRWSYFVSSLGRTLVWVMGSVCLKVIVGFLGALVLNNRCLAGRRVYRTLVIIPWAIPWAMGAMMWAWTFNSQFGVINSLLLRFQLIREPVAFLSRPLSAFLVTMVVDVWAGLPFMVIMLLSGLQSIPETLYEAAAIDGAGPVTRVFRITIPILLPVLLTVSLLSLIWTFNSFDIIWILTRGGPLRATETLPIAIYKTSFLYLRFGGIGKASAMTIAQVILVTMVSLFYIRLLRRREG